MSNKAFSSLNPIDQKLRRLFPAGMNEGTQVTIRKICGFELFNDRPYHNHETWSDGYVVDDGVIQASAEDLDDALNLYEQKRIKLHAFN